MQTATEAKNEFGPEEVILRLREGESHLRNSLVENYQNYVLAIVSKMIGKPAISSDEYSIGLQAFNEAIDSFDTGKNVNFLYFAGLVINRRVIDYIRKARRFQSEYPFTYFEAKDNDNYLEKHYATQPSIFTERLEMQEEILEFKNNLLEFGITFEDLLRLTPKHLDTKLLCLHIAKKLTTSSELSNKLNIEKKLPISEILTLFHLNRKTIDNHRKYIIALYLVLNSNLEVIKSYSCLQLKGVNER